MKIALYKLNKNTTKNASQKPQQHITRRITNAHNLQTEKKYKQKQKQKQKKNRKNKTVNQ